MSDQLTPSPGTTGQNASPCCAAIAELQRRAQERAAQREKADDSETTPSAPDPTPSA